jgi:hypothetical protein
VNRIFNISGAIATILIGVIFLTGCQNDQQAVTTKSWLLVTENSQISLFTIKAEDIGEVFTIPLNNGSVSETGKVTITFAPGEIETGIPIRNSRMGKYLFEIEKWPIATITTQLETGVIEKIATGTKQVLPAKVTVGLHGIPITYDIFLIATMNNNGHVIVSSAKSISVHATDFGLSAGLDKLQELAGLSSITPVIAVNFNLVFESK